MHDKASFIQHLINLKKSGKKSVTVDIDFLLSFVTESSPVKPKKAAPKKPIIVEFDGGSFR